MNYPLSSHQKHHSVNKVFKWRGAIAKCRLKHYISSPYSVMKKKECPSCAMEVDDKEKTCPICQYEFPTQAKGTTWVAVLLLVAIVLWLIL